MRVPLLCRRGLLLLGGLFALAAAAQPEPFPAAASAPLQALLGEHGQALQVQGQPLHAPDAVRAFYAARGYRLAWTEAGCGAAYAELLLALEASAGHGLEPRDYHLEPLRAASECTLAEELLASDAWMTLAAHLRGGRIDPVRVEPDWTAQRPSLEAPAALQIALDSGQVSAVLQALAPQDAFYRALQSALAAEQAQQDAPRPLPVAPGVSLKLGDHGPRVAQLRALLRAEGHAAEPSPAPPAADAAASIETVPAGPGDGMAATAALSGGDPREFFDAGLEAALKAYQQRLNLEPDGVAGPMTLAQLARGPAERVDQLRVNLERWRWLPADLGIRHLRVNIADYRLEAWDQGRIERVYRVVVGTGYRQTPSFSAHLRYVVFNPWWEVPRRLATQDKLPLFQRDPEAFARGGFALLDAQGQPVDVASVDFGQLSRDRFPYRLRQRPGPANALGQVKLILPNDHDVYLHDTPSRSLFSRVRRSFSSGCIRVEDALGLAEWVLDGVGGFDRARIDAVVASGQETRVDLAGPLPVHVLYLTVVSDEAGRLRLIDDLYGRDARVLDALGRRAAR
ncbi:L,D-transpeptidase family protein [Aquimonas voraii]|nr:L,D-transpeptidase family protein [Aquimonas voraii]